MSGGDTAFMHFYSEVFVGKRTSFGQELFKAILKHITQYFTIVTGWCATNNKTRQTLTDSIAW